MGNTYGYGRLFILIFFTTFYVHADEHSEKKRQFGVDGYTFAVAGPTQTQLIAKDYLSGPSHWVKTVSPVEPMLPGTVPLTQKVTETSEGNEPERWESCEGACGAGCGDKEKNKLMKDCSVLNDINDPIDYVWKTSDVNVKCSYERWVCVTSFTCRMHDRALLGLKKSDLPGPVKGIAKIPVHVAAFAFSPVCVWGWMKGKSSSYCGKETKTYSRVIAGSCTKIKNN